MVPNPCHYVAEASSKDGSRRSERAPFALHPPRPQAGDLHGLEPPLTGGYERVWLPRRKPKLEGVRAPWAGRVRGVRARKGGRSQAAGEEVRRRLVTA